MFALPRTGHHAQEVSEKKKEKKNYTLPLARFLWFRGVQRAAEDEKVSCYL
jgi:hypothetical protein